MRVRGYSPTTLAVTGPRCGVFAGYLTKAGIADVREVGSAILRGYQRWLQKQDYAGWTIMARLQAVRRFFDHLEATQALLLNPCSGQEPLKVACRLPKAVLTMDEAKRVLETPNCATGIGLRDKAILEVFYSSGIRLEEMTRLTAGGRRFQNGFLRVNQGKFAKDRVVPLGQSASDCVRRYIEQVRAQWSPPPRNQKALWLSFRQPHEPLKSQVIEVMVRSYGTPGRNLQAGDSAPVAAYLRHAPGGQRRQRRLRPAASGPFLPAHHAGVCPHDHTRNQGNPRCRLTPETKKSPHERTHPTVHRRSSNPKLQRPHHRRLRLSPEPLAADSCGSTRFPNWPA